RAGGVVGPGVQPDDALHPPDDLAAALRQAPRPLLPGLQDIFLRARRTVSRETVSTTSSSTARRASRRTLQRSRPSGASVQASAMTIASCLPSSFAGAPGRGPAVSAAPGPRPADPRGGR